jgi:hypothetical protein
MKDSLDLFTYADQPPQTPSSVGLIQLKPGHQAMPNSWAQSALFGSARPGNPVRVEDMVVASHPDYEISFSGYQLSQVELTVLMDVCDLAWDRLNSGQSPVIQIHPSFLVSQSSHKNGFYLAQYKEALFRLGSGVLNIAGINTKNGKWEKIFAGSLLIVDFGTDPATITVSESIAKMFVQSEAFSLNPLTRTDASSGFESWLAGYFLSNAMSRPNDGKKIDPTRPLHFSVDTIWALSGSKIKAKTSFTQALKKAIGRLQDREVLQEAAFYKGNFLVRVHSNAIKELPIDNVDRRKLKRLPFTQARGALQMS